MQPAERFLQAIEQDVAQRLFGYIDHVAADHTHAPEDLPPPPNDLPEGDSCEPPLEPRETRGSTKWPPPPLNGSRGRGWVGT